MTEQFNIRSKKAREIATRHAQAKGKSLAMIVEEALELFDAQAATEKAERARKMREAMRAIQAGVANSTVTFDIEDLYDEDGLPC